MSTITLPNIRVGSDLQVRVRLKDGGVAIDWSTLQNIKACIYSDAQRALAGRCAFSIDEEDNTLLVCTYAANKPQYLGVNRIVISAKYMGETKTYDKPAFSFVRWTADQEGEEITIDDPDVDVEITVEDVSSSLLDQAIAAALQAAADAEHAAHLIPNQVLLDCEQATADANAAAEAANAAGITSVQVSVEDNEPGTPSADVSLVNKVLSIIFHYLKGNTGEAAGFGAITATVDDVVGDPSVTVTASGPDTAKVLAFAFHGLRGIQGVPGVANAKYKQVDTLPTASADTMDFIYLTPSGTTGVYNMSYTEQDGSTYSWQDLGTTAIQLSDYATKAEVSQLEAKVDELALGNFLGFYPSAEDLPTDGDNPGYAYVGTENQYSIYNYDGTTWTDSGSKVNTKNIEIDVTAPPSGYSGTKVSADSTDNTPALYALMAWAVANYKNPVLRFPKGEYNFATVQMLTFTPNNTIAESLRITGEDATIKYTGPEQRANSGWFHIFYQNTTETRHDFSVEIDHLSFLRTNVTADGTHTYFFWIWGQGSQLADIYLDRIDVHDCTFRGQCAGAIIIGYARQCFIERNKFYNCYEAVDDTSGFIIHNNICYNSIIRNNYMYVDDTKPMCGAGIVVEYQTGCAVIEGNYVYGYNRGIHIEATQRDATQRVLSNYIENCITGIIDWLSLSDIEIVGNRIVTGADWDGFTRVGDAYTEKNPYGIFFESVIRAKSVIIKQNTIRLNAGGGPICTTGEGTYLSVRYRSHNWEVAYNEFYTDGAKGKPFTDKGGNFYLPLYSEIHHNTIYGWSMTVGGSYCTKIHHNDFHLSAVSQQTYLETSNYFYPGGEYSGKTLLAHALEENPNLRGLELEEKYGNEWYQNRFVGLVAPGIAINGTEGKWHDNVITVSSGRDDQQTQPKLLNYSSNKYPTSNLYGWTVRNLVYEYAACADPLYSGIDRNIYYSVDGQGNVSLRKNYNEPYYGKNLYTNSETIEESRKMSHNITCFAISVSSPYATWNKGDYIPGDITINSKWTPSSTLPHHWLCISAGKGVAGDGETQAVWQPIYDNTTIQKTGGTTSQRPTLASGDVGFTYYDSTLGKTIVWNGTAWVNMDGTALT